MYKHDGYNLKYAQQSINSSHRVRRTTAFHSSTLLVYIFVHAVVCVPGIQYTYLYAFYKIIYRYIICVHFLCARRIVKGCKAIIRKDIRKRSSKFDASLLYTKTQRSKRKKLQHLFWRLIKVYILYYIYTAGQKAARG